MNSIFKYFYFNKHERKALFVFLISLLVVHFVVRSFQDQELVQDYQHVEIQPDWFVDDLIDTIKDENEGDKVRLSIIREKPHQQRESKILQININKADSFELRKLNGIGEVYASRIVRYRNWLGGFHKKEQLIEVYGVDSALYDSIKEYLWLQEDSIKKININTCSIRELSAHPYISYKVAKLVVKYREHHGVFLDLETLKSIPLIDEQLFRKIAFYLELE